MKERKVGKNDVFGCLVDDGKKKKRKKKKKKREILVGPTSFLSSPTKTQSSLMGEKSG